MTERALSPPHAATPEPDLSGRRLGDYHILRRLGRGAMAEVYLAEQSSLGRQIALKILKRDLAADQSYVKRFQNEARAAAALVHANIVQIYEVGCQEGLHYIAQEYVPGLNLREYLLRRGVPELPVALAIFRQTCASLTKAADQGIVHRDIKPENILLSPQGDVKVADFGLARIVTGDQAAALNLTQIGVTMGTPLYMSPEQVEGRALDPRSDIYSLGVTMFHLLTGNPPFRGENALSVAVQHLKTPPERLETIRPDLPVGLCRIIHKMLAKNPDERYQSPRGVLLDLRALYRELDTTSWSEDWNEWNSTELTAISDARLAATQQLAEVMQTQAMLLKRENPRRWIVWVSGIALLAGMLGAYLTRERNLLDTPGRAERTVKLASAQEQLEYARMYESGANPQAWRDVIKYFPEDKTAVNNAKRQLAYLHLQANEWVLAQGYFHDLAAEPNDYDHYYGLAGEAIIAFNQNQQQPFTAAWVQLETFRKQLEEKNKEPLSKYISGGLDRMLNEIRAKLPNANE
ncbi:MAG: protein kinase [Pirellulales bacterium]|nr:protein kinase [Pirellulales bacterium]